MKEQEERLAENRKEDTLFERRENLEKHTSYASEREEYQVIRNGQTELVEGLFHRIPDGTPGILAKSSLRHYKNLFIASITLFTRAAIEGGVPEETAYAMSDGYIQTVEECRNLEGIERLRRKAAMRFTEEAKKYGQCHYSPKLEKAMDYISLHLHTPVSLEEIAHEAGISPCYLSRTFKKETGISLVEFIQRERIEAACNMLKYSDYSAAEISQYLCFSNQSYFIRIFKKYQGMTPNRYRKTRKENRF